MSSPFNWRGPILIFLAAFGGIFSAPAAISLNVLSYNIHRDIGASDSNISAQASLASVVNYLKPDVWTINELGGNEVDFSKVNAQSYLTTFIHDQLTIFGANPVLGVDYFVSIGSHNDGYETNAIVSRYPFLATQSYSDAGGGYGALRGLTYALVDVPGTTNDVGIFTMHLKALGTTADAARRQAEADANSARISSWISSHKNYGVIATGDWNESEDAADGTNWDDHAIGDPILLNNGTTEEYHPITTILSAGLNDPAPVSLSGDNDTIGAKNPNARFDYVTYGDNNLSYLSGRVFDTNRYTTSQLAALNSASGLSLAKGTSALASDHLPVFATFAVIPEPGTAALLVVGILVLGWRYGRATRRARPCRRI